MKVMQTYDGQWFEVTRRGRLIGCCDCSLVHRIKVTTRKGKRGVRFWRLDKETKQLRKRGR